MEITKITYRYALNRVLNSGFTKSSTNWDNVSVKRKTGSGRAILFYGGAHGVLAAIGVNILIETCNIYTRQYSKWPARRPFTGGKSLQW